MTVRGRRVLAAGAALAIGVVGGAAPAEGADRTSLRTITGLPRTDHPAPDGNGTAGRGTLRLNSAVSRACNDTDPIAAPQWYSIGERTTGSLRIAANAAEFTLPLGLARVPTGTAVVDHWTGEVLTCEAGAFDRWKKPVDVVAYLTEPFPGTDHGDEEHGDEVDGDYTVFIDRIATNPPQNDDVANARVVSELPFRDELDTSRADGDGPALVHVDPDEPSTSREHGGTVWYRYSPAEDGPAPQVAVAPTTTWTAANGGAGELRAEFFELLPDGGTRLLPVDDGPAALAAGATYLLGVGYAWNAYDVDVLATGGPITVSVTSR